jgi:hypothetical protein
MVKSVLITLCLCVVLQAQSSGRPKAWHRGLPDDGVVSVSRIGQGKVTRELFNEAWLAFRTQYYVESNGAFKPHETTVRLVRSAESAAYVDYKWITEMKYHLGDRSRAIRRLEIAGNADSSGLPIDGFYLAREAPQRRENNFQDKRFVAQEVLPVNVRLFVADPSVVKRGVMEVLSDSFEPQNALPDSNRFTHLREIGPMADSKKLQDSFVEALKAGSRFKVIIERSMTCPYGNKYGDCPLCAGKGTADIPHALTLVW